MGRIRAGWAAPVSSLLLAGIAVTKRASDERAITLLRSAVSGFDAAEMALYGAAARRCLGGAIGGDEGASLIRTADEWMASQTVRNPARLTAMLAPGFRSR